MADQATTATATPAKVSPSAIRAFKEALKDTAEANGVSRLQLRRAFTSLDYALNYVENP